MLFIKVDRDTQYQLGGEENTWYKVVLHNTLTREEKVVARFSSLSLAIEEAKEYETWLRTGHFPNHIVP